MPLKVFDLQCEREHVFEGWFSSADSYDSQQARGLLSCPVCNSTAISKKLSAPRLNVSHVRAADVAADQAPAKAGRAPVAAPAQAQMARLQAEVLRQMREMVRNTENVGARFAEEARRMHECETEERAIRSTATPDEREALASEGIA